MTALAGTRTLRDLRVTDVRAAIAQLSIYAIGYMVLIGLNPLGQKVKTIPFTGEGDVWRQLWYVGVLVMVLVAAQVVRHPSRLFVLPVSVTLALLWSWISLTWSIVPDVGARRLGLTTLMIFVIFRAVNDVGYQRTITALRAMLVLTVVLSFVALKVTPVAIHELNEAGDPNLIGNWRGVLPHKNYAGAVCALTILMFLFDARRIPAALRVAVIAASGFFLVHTHSKTSMGLLGMAVLIGFLYSRYNPAYRALLLPLGAIIAAAFGIYLQANWQEVLAPLYDPGGLTGRVQIWPPMLAFVRDHPITGTGFGSFWNIGPYSPIFEYSKGWIAGLATAHNGYIDMMAQIGIPGLVLVVYSMILRPLGLILTSMAVSRGTGALLIAMLFFCTGHNFTETSLWDRDAIVQVFLSFSVALICLVTVGPRPLLLPSPRVRGVPVRP